ncbi:MarR family winged helix-turn-helix transcriptional regulator [Cryobacterium sp. PH29-G1]|uniref:MarR family winged helix-turn-helix transcriptional regulator n=1 Tax=Cryobacterium sp. PH29-G1 TaxID=3046211 RepID=UPI0024B954E5|nr:MarR family winged helix-turn-helix transcriptional regulator [Cryobacterium sp. PH29-G1]MDJ0350554.1 MarR family winged helix-turn-helix transcriptional regulator [Cryobacterium sp. PH29-G1]
MAASRDRAEMNVEDLTVWSSVATMLERLPAVLDTQLQRDSGLTHFEHGILYALDVAPDRSLRLSTLAGYASCTLSRLSRAVSRMESRGWVERVVDPRDGRFTLGVLTSEGHDKVADSTPGHNALVRRLVFDALTHSQVTQLGIISRRISTAIGPDVTWTPPTSLSIEEPQPKAKDAGAR